MSQSLKIGKVEHKFERTLHHDEMPRNTFACLGFRNVRIFGRYSASLIFAKRIANQKYCHGEVFKMAGPRELQNGGLKFTAWIGHQRYLSACNNKKVGEKIHLTIFQILPQPRTLSMWPPKTAANTNRAINHNKQFV